MRRNIRKIGASLALASLIGGAAPLLAQVKKPPPVQRVIPPKTVYWLSAATGSGFALAGGKAPSAGDMMRMAMGGGGGGPQKMLTLDLGSKLPAAGPPLAAHAIPPGMDMGPSLALKPAKPGKRAEAAQTPDDFERPKGRLLLFWGCGETARPGQPVILDFAKLAAGEVPPGLFGGERVRIANPPSTNTWPTWVGWPNDDKASREGVPGNASMLGAHTVTGNFNPQIDFTLQQDWMAGLEMSQTKTSSGALGLGWNAIPGATAHFAQMMGGAQGSDADGATIVFWSSSEVQTFISGLSDYIAPAEAARLVGKKQLMPASQTSCAVPKEAMAATQGAILTLVAHGPEANFVHPPRPADPKVPWEQEWSVKARFVSRAGGIAGMEMGETGSRSARRERDTGTSGKPKCPTATDAGSMIGGALGGALGMFGKKKKPTDCE